MTLHSRPEAGQFPSRVRHQLVEVTVAGANLKVVSEMLGHSSIGITADTYTSVLPEVARAAAEAAARLVPRMTWRDSTGLISAPSGSENDTGPSSQKKKAQVRRGAPPGTRTPNPRIKSPLLCQLS